MSGNLGANLINQLQSTPMASPDYWTKQMANMNALQEYNARQATARIYQDPSVVDPATGQVNQGRLNALVSQSPAAAWNAAQIMQQQGQAQNAQAVASTNQLGFNDAQQTQIAKGLGAMINQPDSAQTPEAYKAQLQQLVANRTIDPSHLAAANAAIDALGPNPDPTAMRLTATRMLITGLSTADIARQALPQTTLQQFGDVSRPVTVTQGTPGKPGSATVGPGAITIGAPPGTRTPAVVPVDEQGVIPQDANGVPMRPPKSWQPISVPGSPGAPGGGQQVTTPPTSGTSAAPSSSGSGGPPAPPANPAGTVIRSPGAYAPPGSSATPTPGNRGTPPPAPVSSTPLPAPTATPPTPAQPPAVTPAPPAPVVSATPPTFTSAPQGQPEKLAADVGAYTQDQAAYPGVQTRAQNMAHAYDALQQLQVATGKGAAGLQSLRSWAQTMGIAPKGVVDDATLMDLVNKYTTRSMLDAAGGTSTDMGKTLQQEANAGTLLTKPANFQVLRNDMGVQLQKMAAYQDQKDKTGNGYLSSRADVAENTDPRGFVWNMYSPAEQAQINAEVAQDKTGIAADKLHKAAGMAARLKLQIPGPTLAPPGQKQSFLTPPPPPQQNALSMAA